MSQPRPLKNSSDAISTPFLLDWFGSDCPSDFPVTLRYPVWVSNFSEAILKSLELSDARSQAKEVLLGQNYQLLNGPELLSGNMSKKRFLKFRLDPMQKKVYFAKLLQNHGTASTASSSQMPSLRFQFEWDVINKIGPFGKDTFKKYAQAPTVTFPDSIYESLKRLIQTNDQKLTELYNQTVTFSQHISETGDGQLATTQYNSEGTVAESSKATARTIEIPKEIVFKMDIGNPPPKLYGPDERTNTSILQLVVTPRIIVIPDA